MNVVIPGRALCAVMLIAAALISRNVVAAEAVGSTLAEATGFSISTLSRLESGKRGPTPITVPVTQVTSCCFAGRDLDQLLISTSTEDLTPEQLRRQPGAGAIFRADPGCRGRAGTRFGL